jgi:hypothetical protein
VLRNVYRGIVTLFYSVENFWLVCVNNRDKLQKQNETVFYRTYIHTNRIIKKSKLLIETFISAVNQFKGVSNIEKIYFLNIQNNKG